MNITIIAGARGWGFYAQLCAGAVGGYVFAKFIKENNIDIVIVGPEKPLVEGIVDFLENNKISVFGPNKLASKLEGSKIFTKNLCQKYNIPTAKFGVLSPKIKL